MKRLKVFVVAILMGFMSLHSIAYADEATAKAALKTAVIDAQARTKTAPNLRFSFSGHTQMKAGTKEKHDKDDMPSDKAFTFDPSKPKAQQYVLLHPTQAEDADERAEILSERKEDDANSDASEGTEGDDQELILDTEDFADLLTEAVYLRETNESWVFTVPLPEDELDLGDMMEMDEGGEKALSEKERKKAEKIKARMFEFMKSMKSELHISKADNRFTRAHIYSTQSVKIEKGIKLKKLEMIMDFIPIWKDGPLITHRETQKMQVKLVFIKMGMTETTVYSDFERR